MLLPLHIECIKAGFTTAIYFWGCYYIRVENFVADVVFQRVTAFKTVQSDIFVAFLSLFYFSITVSAKAASDDISYFVAILLKKITKVVHYLETRILLHIECTGGKLVITDRTTPKCIQITIRTLADA